MLLALPLALSALSDAGGRITPAAFSAHHGRDPGDTATVAEWMVTPPPANSWWLAMLTPVECATWVLADALPRAYPEHTAAVHRMVVDVAWRAATRVLPKFEATPRRALEVVRRWLDGEVIGSDTFLAAAAAVAPVGADPGTEHGCAAARAVCRAAAGASRGDSGAVVDGVAAALTRTRNACGEGHVPSRYYGYTGVDYAALAAEAALKAERTRQLRDLEEVVVA